MAANTMPVIYEIHSNGKRVDVHYTGVVSPEENLASYESYLADPLARPVHDYFVDLSELTEIDSTFERMQNMVARLTPLYARRAPGARTAIYAPSDTAYGVGRMFESLNSIENNDNVGVFRVKSEAEAFLVRKE